MPNISRMFLCSLPMKAICDTHTHSHTRTLIHSYVCVCECVSGSHKIYLRIVSIFAVVAAKFVPST